VIADPLVVEDECALTAKDVSAELQKLEGSFSKINSLQALRKLRGWLIHKQNESSINVLDNFHWYGGVARIFDFMETNMDDWECVASAAALISDFLALRWNNSEQKRKIATEAAHIIIRRKGIKILLLAVNCDRMMNRNVVLSDAMHVWVVIGRIINGEENRGMIDNQQKFCILKAAIDFIHRLQRLESGHHDINVRSSDVLLAVLYAIANNIKDPFIQKGHLINRDLVGLCVTIMEMNDGWNQNHEVVTYLLGILIICTKEKNITSKNRFEQLLPLLVRSLSVFGENTEIRSFALVLLESTCEKVSKEKIVSTGVIEAVSALLKLECLDPKTTEKVRDVIKKM